MPRPLAWLDGWLGPAEEARLPVTDPGVLHGDGVFTVLAALGGHPVDGAAHLARLAAHARRLGLPHRPLHEVAAAVDQVLRAFGPVARVRVCLTRAGRCLVVAEDLHPAPSSVRLVTVDWPLPLRGGDVKTLSYADRWGARALAVARGADEAIRLTAAGHVGECALANLFLVIDGRGVTAPTDGQILAGVTRARVLSLAPSVGVDLVIRTIDPAELVRADEAFVTSSARGLVPVAGIDGRPLLPLGPVTEALVVAYARFLGGVAAQPAGAATRWAEDSAIVPGTDGEGRSHAP